LLLVLVVAVGVLAVGAERQTASAAPRETPAHKITRLRAKAGRVQRHIDRMNSRVERLVEDYNAVREALGRTRAEQARTQRRMVEARHRLEAAKRQLGRRLRVAYTGGAPTALGQLRRELAALAAQLAEQRRCQERLQARLVAQRERIEDRLAAQRRYLSRLTKEVKRAIIAERRRQEELRRRALLRRLAAERAARARAAARAETRWRGQTRCRGARAGRGSGAARQAVAFAMAQIGKPYLWGAAGPSAYDCSGLMLAAYCSAGIYLPRVSRAQWYAGPHVGLGDLAPGDLVFFAHNTGAPATIHHVGMYVGGGAMVEAPYTGARVRTASIGRGDYIGAVRPTG
jgi:cell wall-associated NlpC family hydrolase